MQTTFLSTLAKTAREAGVTPWTGLAQFQKVMDRMVDGAAVAVLRAGPKDARIEIAALPFVDVPYLRAAFRGFTVAACDTFATRVCGKDVPEVRGGARAAYRVAWA